ncbi:MAG: TetR/AcrR family transcriptional regulator [Devosiaceae bacterium]|nr:TetR/AcrR family transcriptional regulator [Devosiaceae bacterium]
MNDIAKASKGEVTRKKISKSASRLLDEKGYFGTGINDILADAKAPKGSIYFHFPGGKQQVAATAIKDIGDEIAFLLSSSLASADRPEMAIKYIFAYFKTRLFESGFSCGCPISTVGLELSGTQSITLMACREAYSSWTEILQEYLAKFISNDQAIELADTIFCQIQGALLVSRINGDIKHLNNASVHCTKLVNDALTQDTNNKF